MSQSTQDLSLRGSYGKGMLIIIAQFGLHNGVLGRLLVLLEVLNISNISSISCRHLTMEPFQATPGL